MKNVYLKPFWIALLAAVLGFISYQPAKGQCYTQPGVARATGNVNFGTNLNWANPNAIDASDDTYARAKIGRGEITKFLHAYDFGFVVPAGATITGIQVMVEKKQDIISEIADFEVRLVKNGVITGTNRAQVGILWPIIDGISAYGSPVDTWGTNWTAADINNSQFGFMISANRIGGGLGLPSDYHAFIDHITVQVFYVDQGCLLGIELGDFSASQVNNSISLSWMTLSEWNNQEFEIQRSNDREVFEALETVPGAGTRNEPTFYDTQDPNPQPGYNFYRLKQVDQDGSESYSEIRSVYFNGKLKSEINTYPNPATDQLNITWMGEAGQGEISLYNLTGSKVYSSTTYVGRGETVPVEISSLPAGQYIVRMKIGPQAKQKLIIKQ